MDLSSRHIPGNSIRTANTICPASYLYFAAKFILRNETSTAYISETRRFPVVKSGQVRFSNLNLEHIKKSKQSEKVTLASRNTLKSKENYKDAIFYPFNMYQSLETYAKRNILPLPADWPGCYYPKTLIAQGREKRISNIVPEHGPFHVYLNATEDVVLIFKFFFNEMYKFVFGGILPQKPRPFRCSLCITAALLGWILVRDKVLPKFGLCKGHEFASILYLLDHVVPLVFFHYQTFRSGNMEEYECLMAQLAILFISWQRHHYNKSTLSFLSDLAYQKTFLPKYFRVKLQWLSVIKEKICNHRKDTKF